MATSRQGLGWGTIAAIATGTVVGILVGVIWDIEPFLLRLAVTIAITLVLVSIVEFVRRRQSSTRGSDPTV